MENFEATQGYINKVHKRIEKELVLSKRHYKNLTKGYLNYYSNISLDEFRKVIIVELKHDIEESKKISQLKVNEMDRILQILDEMPEGWRRNIYLDKSHRLKIELRELWVKNEVMIRTYQALMKKAKLVL